LKIAELEAEIALIRGIECTNIPPSCSPSSSLHDQLYPLRTEPEEAAAAAATSATAEQRDPSTPSS